MVVVPMLRDDHIFQASSSDVALCLFCVTCNHIDCFDAIVAPLCHVYGDVTNAAASI